MRQAGTEDTGMAVPIRLAMLRSGRVTTVSEVGKGNHSGHERKLNNSCEQVGSRPAQANVSVGVPPLRERKL